MAFATGNCTAFRGIYSGGHPFAKFGFSVLTGSTGSSFKFDSKKEQLMAFCKTFDFSSPPRGEKVLELVGLLKEFADANESSGGFSFRTESGSRTAKIMVAGEGFSAVVALSCKGETEKYYLVNFSTSSVKFDTFPGKWEFPDAIEMLAGALFSHGKKSLNASLPDGEEFTETE